MNHTIRPLVVSFFAASAMAMAGPLSAQRLGSTSAQLPNNVHMDPEPLAGLHATAGEAFSVHARFSGLGAPLSDETRLASGAYPEFGVLGFDVVLPAYLERELDRVEVLVVGASGVLVAGSPGELWNLVEYTSDGLGFKVLVVAEAGTAPNIVARADVANSMGFRNPRSAEYQASTPPTRIYGFAPSIATPGDMITLDGMAFASNPNDYCFMVMDGGVQSGFARVRTSSTFSQSAELTGVPPTATGGQIMIAAGDGNVAPAIGLPLDMRLRSSWTWLGIGLPPVSAGGAISFPDPFQIGAGSLGHVPGKCLSFYGALNSGLYVSLILPGDLYTPKGSKFYVQMDGAIISGPSFDQAAEVVSKAPWDAMGCAVRIGGQFQLHLFQNGVFVDVQATTLSSGDVELGILPPTSSSFAYGGLYLDVCLSHVE